MDDNQVVSQLTDRVLYLSGDIADSNTSDIAKQILKINEIDKYGVETYRQYRVMPIQLHVQSFGGSVYDMWALIDIIEQSTTPIITICEGYCMSAAALIFMAGHARYMGKHSTLMLHQMWTLNAGKINDIGIEIKNTTNLHKHMIKFIKKHTKLGKKFFKHFDKDKEDVYLSAKKCLKYGICDEITESSNWREDLLDIMRGSNQAES
jgi:ATP-dependent Clp protease protease subunit